MSQLDRPILVLGAARSGTTLLAETLLAQHQEVAYWPEPVFIWRYGNAYRMSDVIGPEYATPKVKAYIRRRFREYTEERGASRFLEKTPSNCLRVPFLLEVLPDARIVHIFRDGRDAARSTADEWAGPGQDALEYTELRQGGRFQQARSGLSTWLRLGERVDDLRSLLELPAYTGRFLGFLARHLLRTDRLPWGPRFPGLWRIRSSYSLLETCAIQWQLCVNMARSACLHLPSDQYLEVRYEDLVTEPHEELAQIFRFLELDIEITMLEELTNCIVCRSVPLWPGKLSSEDVMLIERHIASTLQDLGYSLQKAV